MKYEVKFFEMLTALDDEILNRTSNLNLLKRDLAEMEDTGGRFGLVEDREKEELRNQIGELYLSIQYAQSLRADLAPGFTLVKCASAFINHTYNDETFNMLFEEYLGDE